MNKPQDITDANFQSEVLNSDLPVLVNFWAAWCGPCRAVSPTIEELADENDGRIKVGKLNIDENQQAPRELGIHSIPAVLLFRHGEVGETLIGVQPKERYQDVLDRVAA